jgi:hypothetical protein
MIQECAERTTLKSVSWFFDAGLGIFCSKRTYSAGGSILDVRRIRKAGVPNSLSSCTIFESTIIEQWIKLLASEYRIQNKMRVPVLGLTND